MSWLANPEKERQRKARSRASQIREGITNYIKTLGVIATAYRERDWEMLGYATWRDYIDGEFPAERLGIPAEYREKAMSDLRLAGLSTRAIAPVVGAHHSTVARQVSHDATPEPVQGIDGKTYSPARSPIAEAMEQAIEDATDRAQTHPVPAPGEADATPPASEADVPSSPSAADVADNPSAGPESVPPIADSGPPNLPGEDESGSGATSLVPDPDLDQWRENFRFALSVARSVMDRPPDEVARCATREQLEELLKLLNDLGRYSDDIAEHL